jgi:hypothetical protein
MARAVGSFPTSASGVPCRSTSSRSTASSRGAARSVSVAGVDATTRHRPTVGEISTTTSENGGCGTGIFLVAKVAEFLGISRSATRAFACVSVMPFEKPKATCSFSADDGAAFTTGLAFWTAATVGGGFVTRAVAQAVRVSRPAAR